MIAMFNNQLVVSLSSLYFTEKKKGLWISLIIDSDDQLHSQLATLSIYNILHNHPLTQLFSYSLFSKMKVI